MCIEIYKCNINPYGHTTCTCTEAVKGVGIDMKYTQGGIYSAIQIEHVHVYCTYMYTY